MNKKLILTSVVFMISLSLTSCATIFGDNSRAISVNSHPQGAGIYVDGLRHGTTPSIVTLPAYVYGGKTICLKKEGYHDQAMILNTRFQPCGLWNLLFWPGFLIDGATGNTVKIDPNNLNLTAQLQAVEASQSK